jgi:hypothetical protein
MGDAGPIGTSPEAGTIKYVADPVGRDAAWNRAVALRRIEDKKDAGNDAAPPDGGGDGGGDNKDQNKDGGGNDDQNKDGGKDGGDNDDKNKDAGKDSGGDEQKDPPKKDPPKEEPDAGAQPPPPSRQSQDERMLDQLENAPTVQQEAAKKHAKGRKVRGMADK